MSFRNFFSWMFTDTPATYATKPTADVNVGEFTATAARRLSALHIPPVAKTDLRQAVLDRCKQEIISAASTGHCEVYFEATAFSKAGGVDYFTSLGYNVIHVDGSTWGADEYRVRWS
jgi:hypothetical protein